MATRPFHPFTPSQLLLSLPDDDVTQMVFDSLSTKQAAILSSVNVQLRDFALAHTPASWQNIFIELPNAEKLASVLIFLAKLSTNAKSFELYIGTNAIDINALHLFPTLPNVRRLVLSRNRWLQCDHLELLANRMPAATQLETDGCRGLTDNNSVPRTEPFLEIVNRNYGPLLTVFSCAKSNNVLFPQPHSMLAQFVSNLSNVTKFNMDQTAVVCPTAAVAGMLNRSPGILELLCENIYTDDSDAETQTFLLALSSCQRLTHLSLTFHFLGTPLKPWAFRAAFAALGKLKILKLILNHVSFEGEDGEDVQNGQNYPFQLDSLVIGGWSHTPPFLRDLVVDQVGYLKILQVYTGNFMDMFTGIFAQDRPRLRELSIGFLDYSSAHFTPPVAGYRRILDRVPALMSLRVRTMDEAQNEDDHEILEALAMAYPSCDVEIDHHKLSTERRLAIAAGLANE